MKSWMIGLLLLSTSVAVHSKMAAPSPILTQSAQAQQKIQEVVSAFYATAKEVGVPNQAELKQLKSLISPSLHALLLQARSIEDQCAKVAVKDEKPIMIDQSLFSGTVEGLTKIEFTQPAAKKILEYHIVITAINEGFPGANETFRWKNDIKLIPHKQTWLIDDITFRVEEKSSTTKYQTLRTSLNDYIAEGKKACYSQTIKK